MGYPLNVIIDEDLLQVLQAEAEERGLSLSALGREAIMEKYRDALKKLRQQRQTRTNDKDSNHNP